ncbi:type II toxin-antitoxin system YafO family toxin [Pantoea sp. At-9b]|uniref:type II toxin-antitoxin system YafO family toxin n=1 Tax=Pantoea sp. (strain At-9b) TaxID=592316 RepID=UPI0001B3E48B|nr:type II toxin-antitoxin system YafO family toxin [Pantoea sp. At-9b]ADU72612.1 conserved hypothetical protein [Pantoea sp. At-9b]
MAYAVSIHKDVEFQQIAKPYAKALQDWKNNGVLPDRFGSEGQWEHNARLCDSHVYKIHIRLPAEQAWPKNRAQIDRTSDHYLVYTKHWMSEERIQIISIMSPKGHQMANTSFLAVLEARAEDFQNE